MLEYSLTGRTCGRDGHVGRTDAQTTLMKSTGSLGHMQFRTHVV
jgi:hypothetical protein